MCHSSHTAIWDTAAFIHSTLVASRQSMYTKVCPTEHRWTDSRVHLSINYILDASDIHCSTFSAAKCECPVLIHGMEYVCGSLIWWMKNVPFKIAMSTWSVRPQNNVLNVILSVHTKCKCVGHIVKFSYTRFSQNFFQRGLTHIVWYSWGCVY